MAASIELRAALGGISGILITPFDSADQIAPARLRPIVDRAIAAGRAGDLLHIFLQQRQAVDVPAVGTETAAASDQLVDPLRQMLQECDAQFGALLMVVVSCNRHAESPLDPDFHYNCARSALSAPAEHRPAVRG